MVVIRDEVLADALFHRGVKGIIAGADLKGIVNTFNTFSLHVKARKLDLELHGTLPAANAAMVDAIAA